MPIAAEELITRLSLQGRSRYSAELQAAGRSVAGFRAEVSSTGGVAESVFGKMTLLSGGIQTVIGIAKAAATAVVGIGVAGVFLANKLTDTAADADKARARYQSVFGDLTGQVDGFIANLQNKFGTPTDVLESNTAQFARMAEAVGVARQSLVPFSESMTQAGVDLASFYNLDPGDVFTALQRGVAGQMRGLKALGIVIRDTDVTERAREMGLGSHATEGQRMMIRQQMIMAQVGVVTRNLATDSGSLANQQRELKNRMHELEVNAGRAFTPLKLLAVEGLNRLLIPATEHLKNILPTLKDDFSDTGIVMQRIRPILGFLGDGIHSLTSGGPLGLADWLDRILNSGTFFHTMVDSWIRIFTALVTIARGAVFPVLHEFSPLLTLASVNVWLLAHGLEFLADHLGIAKALMIPVVGYLLLMGVRAEYAMVKTIALTAVEKIRQGLQFFGIGVTEAEVTAEEAQAAAMQTLIGLTEQLIALNQELVASQTGVVTANTTRAVSDEELVAINENLAASEIGVAGASAGGSEALGGLAIAEGGAAAGAAGMLLPILAIVAAIVALVLIVIVIIVYWDTLTEAAKRLWHVLEDNPFTHLLVLMFALGTGIGEVWLAIEYGPDVVRTATGAIVGAFYEVMDAMTAVGEFGGRMFDGMVGGVRLAMNGVLSILETGMNAAIGVVNGGIGWVNDVNPFSDIPEVPTVSMPRLHMGGRVVVPGAVNMRPGEEMVNLPAGAQVVPLSANRSAATPAAAGPREPQIIQLVVDRKTLAEVVVDGNADIEARQ